MVATPNRNNESTGLGLSVFVAIMGGSRPVYLKVRFDMRLKNDKKTIDCYKICFPDEDCPTHHMNYVRRKLRYFFGSKFDSFNNTERNKARLQIIDSPIKNLN